jgi:hypothetical protein
MPSSPQVERKRWMSMASGRVPVAVRTRLGDDATFGLIELLDSDRKEWSEHVLSVAADRFERRLAEEISALREEIHEELHDGLVSVRQELATSRRRRHLLEGAAANVQEGDRPA